MKGTIIFSCYDSSTGVSVVKKATKYGEFIGRAVVNEEDYDVANRWDGCRFAEYKCDMQAQKRKANLLYARYEGIQNAYNNIYDSLNDLSTTSVFAEYAMDLFYRQADHAYHQYEEAIDKYYAMKDGYKDFCTRTIAGRRKLREHVEFRDYPDDDEIEAPQ